MNELAMAWDEGYRAAMTASIGLQGHPSAGASFPADAFEHNPYRGVSNPAECPYLAASVHKNHSQPYVPPGVHRIENCGPPDAVHDGGSDVDELAAMLFEIEHGWPLSEQFRGSGDPRKYRERAARFINSGWWHSQTRLRENDLSSLLLEHRLRVTPTDGCFCACGDFSVGRGPGADAAHSQHVADAIRKASTP